jgi:hypothetical protein
MRKQKTFSQLDFEELAAHLVGYSEEDEYEMHDVESRLMEMYNLDLSYFIKLMARLGDLIDMSVSPLTEEPFIGFSTDTIWLAKKPFPKFINAVLVWMSAEQIRDGKARGYERKIHSGGKPEFKLVLMKADQEYKFVEPEAASAPKGLIAHGPDEIPPVSDDSFAKRFQMSDEFFAEIKNPEDEGIPMMTVVHYSHRSNCWVHSREGENAEVITWWSKKDVSNV